MKQIIVSVMQTASALRLESLDSKNRIRAMGLSFLTLISIVPILGVIISFIRFVDPQVIHDFLNLMLQPMGEQGQPIVEGLFSLSQQATLTNIGIVGVLFALFTWLSGMRLIESTVSEIWCVSPRRLGLRNLSIYALFIFLLPFAILLSVLVIYSMTQFEFFQWVQNSTGINFDLSLPGNILSILILCLVFSSLYKLIPNTYVKFKYALAGGVFTTFSWITVGLVFSNLILELLKFNLVYSSYSSLIVFALWVFISWIIVILGIHLTFFLQHPIYTSVRPVDFELSIHHQEMLALTIYKLIKNNHEINNSSTTRDELIESLALPLDQINIAISRITDSGAIQQLTQKEYALTNKKIFTDYELIKEIRHIDQLPKNCSHIKRILNRLSES